MIAYESAGVAAKTDIRIQDATIEFYNMGVFTRAGGPEQTSALGLVARDGTVNKEILINNTPIKLLDWADVPAGRYTTQTKEGGKLNAGGNVKLDGTTELVLRVNVGNHRMDTVFDATGSVTLTGNALKLTLDLRNTAGQMMFMFPSFIWGTALTAPANPFGGGVSAPGWTPTITAHANSLDLVLMKM